MALSVQTNVASLTAQRNLLNSTSRLNTSLNRLSTGLKINRASDDASGLVISENQRAQISGLNQAVANIDRDINLVQTAESGLSEINSALLTIRQLAVDSANSGANDADALAANQAEIDNLLDTIDGISGRTKFGTINLLNGSSGVTGQATSSAAVSFVDATGRVTINTANTQAAVNILTAGQRAEIEGTFATLSGAATLTINGVVFNFDEGATRDQVADAVNRRSSDTGIRAATDGAATNIQYQTIEFGFDQTISVSASDTDLGATPAVQTARGADIGGTIGGVAGSGTGRFLKAGGITVAVNADTTAGASESTFSGAQGVIRLLDGNSRIFQIGAFENETAELSISNFATGSLGLGNNLQNGSDFVSLADVDVTTQNGAQDTIQVTDYAIGQVARARGEIGAFQANTLERTQSNVRTELTNLEAAESTVRDTDFATEIAKFTAEQIRQQAASTVLGLANQSAQGILSLLNG